MISLCPLLLLAPVPPQADELPKTERPPSVVIILADDMGSGDLAVSNPETRIPTPHLDRLAAAGMRLTDAHSPSGVCSPTRYALLTGRYAWRSRLKKGVLDGHSRALIEPGRATIASLLKERGYATACVGKWHLGLGDVQPTDYGQALRPGPQDVGFDSFFGIPASLDMEPYVYVRNESPVEPPSSEVEGSQHRRQDGGGFWRKGRVAAGFRHADVLPSLEREALAFLAQRALTPETPFFLYMPLSAPHTPWLPTAEFRGKSGAGWYGDFVMQVDATVGSVLRALDQHGFAENTIVIFTSDNGAHWPVADIERYGHAANGAWRGQKADIWEGGHRVPFVLRWPGVVKPGRVSGEPICLTDLFATCASIAGSKYSADAGEDSVDLTPLLRDKLGSQPLREAVVHHSMSGVFAIRQGRWKLIEGRGSGGFTAPRKPEVAEGMPAGQLYDLESDPGERSNLYMGQPEVVARLAALLDTYREQGHSQR
jgi:arylsulfatase A